MGIPLVIPFFPYLNLYFSTYLCLYNCVLSAPSLLNDLCFYDWLIYFLLIDSQYNGNNLFLDLMGYFKSFPAVKIVLKSDTFWKYTTFNISPSIIVKYLFPLPSIGNEAHFN